MLKLKLYQRPLLENVPKNKGSTQKTNGMMLFCKIFHDISWYKEQRSSYSLIVTSILKAKQHLTPGINFLWS